jgi:hypothetical protein
LTCPADIYCTVKKGEAEAVVQYPEPALGGCIAAKCKPKAGSKFKVGTTTVECEGTPADGATTSRCSFTVNVFKQSYKDDTQEVMLFIDKKTGDYTVTPTGNGAFTMVENSPTQRMTLNVAKGANGKTASMSFEKPPGTEKCKLTDTSIKDSKITCPEPP